MARTETTLTSTEMAELQMLMDELIEFTTEPQTTSHIQYRQIKRIAHILGLEVTDDTHPQEL